MNDEEPMNEGKPMNEPDSSEPDSRTMPVTESPPVAGTTSDPNSPPVPGGPSDPDAPSPVSDPPNEVADDAPEPEHELNPVHEERLDQVKDEGSLPDDLPESSFVADENDTHGQQGLTSDFTG